MRILSAIFAVLFWTSAVWAVELTTEDEAAIKNQITSVMTQYNSGNHEALIDAMPPSVVALSGGRDKLKAAFSAAMQQQKEQKFSFESITPGEPGEPFMAGTTTICFVPTESVIKVDDKRMRSIGFMVASRAQGEARWRLMEGNNLPEMPPQFLSTVFPGIPEELDFPPVEYEELP